MRQSLLCIQQKSISSSNANYLSNSGLVKQLPASNEARQFITMFASSCQPPLPIHKKATHISKRYFFMVNFNVILPSTPRSSEWFLPFRIFIQNFIFISFLPLWRSVSHPSHTSWSDYHNNIWWRENIRWLRSFVCWVWQTFQNQCDCVSTPVGGLEPGLMKHPACNHSSWCWLQFEYQNSK